MNHSFFFLTLGVFSFFASLANAEEWKLQPLKYNNPGLVVDLGVGLWAWPLPMDYDGDGDIDLVVSGPDKPTNVLNLAVSEDGKIWKEVATIEKEDTGEFSYPAMIQSSDELIHMTYTWKRQKVKHVVVDPAKLVAGKTLSLDSN